MNNSQTSAAVPEGEAMIEWLATKVMGWKKKPLPRSLSRTNWWWQGEVPTEFTAFGYRNKLDWNPLADWNHWRQVEEKVMENQALFMDWMLAMDKAKRNVSLSIVFSYLSNDPPVRAKALYLAKK